MPSGATVFFGDLQDLVRFGEVAFALLSPTIDLATFLTKTLQMDNEDDVEVSQFVFDAINKRYFFARCFICCRLIQAQLLASSNAVTTQMKNMVQIIKRNS